MKTNNKDGKAVEFVVEKIRASLDRFTDVFPGPCSEDLMYPAIPNNDWTTSFRTGMLWLAYQFTGDKEFRKKGEEDCVAFRRRLDRKVMVDTHDLGFLYTLSCVAGYKVTGSPEARETALEAAEALINRYLPKAGILQAWGSPDDPVNRGRMIIDCLMNLPLLRWAAREGENQRFQDIADSHLDRTLEYLIRPDGTTFHSYVIDPDTGEPIGGETVQGYGDQSCWARGQAWAIYGLALAYGATKDVRILEAARKVIDYFLQRLPEDGVCYWDLTFTSGTEERDSSAAAIAACGLLEMSENLPEDNPNHRQYRNEADRIIDTLSTSYLNTENPKSSGLLLHAVYNKPKNEGVDECCIWGDYFYMEALRRRQDDWDSFWR